MLGINEYQDLVDKWIKEYGVRYFNETTNTILLMEEMGEFSRLIARKYGEQSFKKEINPASVDLKIKEELSDIIFVLTCLANQMDIDLELCLRANLDKKTNRDYSRHKSNPKLNKASD